MMIFIIIGSCLIGGGILVYLLIRKRRSKSNVKMYSLNNLIEDIRKRAEETIDKKHLKILYNNTLMIKKKFSHKKEAADAKDVLKLIHNKIYEQSEFSR